MIKFPSGWTNVTIGDVAEVSTGSTPKRSESKYWESANIPWLTSSVTGLPICKSATQFISSIAVKECRLKTFSKGTLLLAMYGEGKTRGQVTEIQIDATCNQACAAIVVDLKLASRKFVKYRLLENYQATRIAAAGGNQPNLNLNKVRGIDTPLAPLNEQKRIVEKIDSLLAQVDTIQQRLNTLPNIIKRFRQSVLAAAVSGKLTLKWREGNDAKLLTNLAELNLIERKERLSSRVQKAKQCQKPESFSIPCSWCWVSIDEACIKITDGTHHSPVSSPEGDFKYVTSKNVREGYIDLSKITYVNKEVHSEIYSRCDVVKGDVLYVKDGANTGLACVNDFEEEISLLSSVGVMKVASYLNPVYLQHYLNSPIGRKLMLDLMGGTAIKRLTLTKIKVSPLSLPPIEEQTEIVRLVEQHFALADTLEKHLKNAKQRVDNLTQSILAKAFKGELVPQDPNDEPAEQLLARIKAARAEAEQLEKAAKKVGKKTTKNKK